MSAATSATSRWPSGPGAATFAAWRGGHAGRAGRGARRPLPLPRRHRAGVQRAAADRRGHLARSDVAAADRSSAPGTSATLRAPAGSRQAIAAGALAGALLRRRPVAAGPRRVRGGPPRRPAQRLAGSLRHADGGASGTSGFWVPTVIGLLVGAAGGHVLDVAGEPPAVALRRAVGARHHGPVRGSAADADAERPPVRPRSLPLRAGGPDADRGRADRGHRRSAAYQFQQRYRIERRIATMPADRRRTAHRALRDHRVSAHRLRCRRASGRSSPR